jgi:hypothetical protein
MKKSFIILALVGAAYGQQTINGSRTILGTWDASQSPKTIPSTTGVIASRPTACTVGQFYFATDATAGQNISLCTTTGTPGTWTTVTGGGGSSAGEETVPFAFGAQDTTIAVNDIVKPGRLLMAARTLVKCRVYAETAGTGDSTIDILKNGTSVFSGSLLTLSGGTTSGSTTTFATTSFSEGDRLSAKVVTVGSASPLSVGVACRFTY